MIRHRHGSDFLLITQDDHARLSGKLAEHFGNDRFAAPLPRKQVIDAIAMHDSGWPLHDGNPTLNPAGSPLHVFESPIAISTRVWSESARRATAVDPYTGLLVSLHVLALSATVHKPAAAPGDKQRQELFLLNQFQQDQIELQDDLRRRLGLRTDIPLRLGLAMPDAAADDEREEMLAFNYKILRLLDRLSLELCCSEALPWKVDALPPYPAAAPAEISIHPIAAGQVTVDPWPFAADPVEFQVPFRRVPETPFTDEQMFRETYQRAPVEQMAVQVTKLG